MQNSIVVGDIVVYFSDGEPAIGKVVSTTRGRGSYRIIPIKKTGFSITRKAKNIISLRKIKNIIS